MTEEKRDVVVVFEEASPTRVSDDHSCQPSSKPRGTGGFSGPTSSMEWSSKVVAYAVHIFSGSFTTDCRGRIAQGIALVTYVLRCMSHETVPQIPTHPQAHPPDRMHTLLGPKHSRLPPFASANLKRCWQARRTKDLHSKHTLEQREHLAQPLGPGRPWTCGTLWKGECICERTGEWQLG